MGKGKTIKEVGLEKRVILCTHVCMCMWQRERERMKEMGLVSIIKRENNKRKSRKEQKRGPRASLLLSIYITSFLFFFSIVLYIELINERQSPATVQPACVLLPTHSFIHSSPPSPLLLPFAPFSFSPSTPQPLWFPSSNIHTFIYLF